MSYAIQWDFLLPDEIDFLQRVGVQMYPSGVSFKRPPSWEDFTLVFAYLHGLKNRTLQEENHTSSAIGDCLNAGTEFFGKNRVDEWIKGFLRLCYMRDRILSVIGATLSFLQVVEQQIK